MAHTCGSKNGEDTEAVYNFKVLCVLSIVLYWNINGKFCHVSQINYDHE